MEHIINPFVQFLQPLLLFLSCAGILLLVFLTDIPGSGVDRILLFGFVLAIFFVFSGD
ncbi:unnamed protein product [Periconia digitata]|uniref:Uncharacterized protein n=1 Tax=Periconia digitata TaxID=1303443 RepID=A0A9W4U7D1_9PLEO|nr:unnamed protein product [Periconia digitata]